MNTQHLTHFYSVLLLVLSVLGFTWTASASAQDTIVDDANIKSCFITSCPPTPPPNSIEADVISYTDDIGNSYQYHIYCRNPGSFGVPSNYEFVGYEVTSWTNNGQTPYAAQCTYQPIPPCPDDGVNAGYFPTSNETCDGSCQVRPSSVMGYLEGSGWGPYEYTGGQCDTPPSQGDDDDTGGSCNEQGGDSGEDYCGPTDPNYDGDAGDSGDDSGDGSDGDDSGDDSGDGSDGGDDSGDDGDSGDGSDDGDGGDSGDGDGSGDGNGSGGDGSDDGDGNSDGDGGDGDSDGEGDCDPDTEDCSDGSASGGESCDQAPQCDADADPVGCSILQQNWLARCGMSSEDINSLTKGVGDAGDKALDEAVETLTEDLEQFANEGVGFADQPDELEGPLSGLLPEPKGCTPVTLDVPGPMGTNYSAQLDCEHFNTFKQYFGYFLAVMTGVYVWSIAMRPIPQ